MNLPCNFIRYFCLAAFLLFAGIVIVIIQSTIIYGDVAPLNETQLQVRADYHSQTIIPAIAKVYPLLLFANAGVALFILMVPLFWVWVWWFQREMLDITIRVMQATVTILMVALGHNSFDMMYLTYRLLSWQMIAIMYIPHGWLEMLAFILAGTTAFLTIDALKKYLQENGSLHTLHPGEICLFIFDRVWRIGIMIFLFMAIAAAIECWVTPGLVESAFAVALQNRT